MKFSELQCYFQEGAERIVMTTRYQRKIMRNRDDDMPRAIIRGFIAGVLIMIILSMIVSRL
jgi:hypothetical protein